MPWIELDYAKAGVTPGCGGFKIIDVGTGEERPWTIEANAAEGWRVEIITDRFGVPIRNHETGRRLTQRFERATKILAPVQDETTKSIKLARAQAKRLRQAERQAKGMRT